MDEEFFGVKGIKILATSAYPIVSAYEFEFLKNESIFKKNIEGATIYFLLQRPLMFFDNVILDEGGLFFDIADGINEPLQCFIGMEHLGITPGEECEINIQWYREPELKSAPFKEVAAFQVFNVKNDFVVWETPQKILYERFSNDLPMIIKGDFLPYMKYHIHYIGQAFSQEIWKRLTGHEKIQKILTLEEPLNRLTTRPSLELSIMMLSITGFDEEVCINYDDLISLEDPILHAYNYNEDNELFENFYLPFFAPNDKRLTNEAEALLIRIFLPKYNSKKYKAYPKIAEGARSAGYSYASIHIEKFPVELSTENYTQAAEFNFTLQRNDII